MAARQAAREQEQLEKALPSLCREVAREVCLEAHPPARHSVPCTLDANRSTPCAVQLRPSALHPALCTLNPKPYTPCSLNPQPCIMYSLHRALWTVNPVLPNS